MLVGAKSALRTYSPTVETMTVIRPFETEPLDPTKGPRVVVSATTSPLAIDDVFPL
jgi:hypothetical protein